MTPKNRKCNQTLDATVARAVQLSPTPNWEILVQGSQSTLKSSLAATRPVRLTFHFLGSGCGAVGRAVAYDTRGPRFKSSHWQLLLNIYLLLTVCRKDENKDKRPGMALLFRKKIYKKNNLTT